MKVDPTSTEIVIKEWKEVRMGELFETNGLSAVLHTFAEKEWNPLMTLEKDSPQVVAPLTALWPTIEPHPCGCS